MDIKVKEKDYAPNNWNSDSINFYCFNRLHRFIEECDGTKRTTMGIMTLLKDSEDAEKIKLVHSDIWTKLQDQDELYAKTFLDDCFKSCEKKRVKYILSGTIKDYIKSPIIWISIIIGVLIVTVFWLAFIWISLILE